MSKVGVIRNPRSGRGLWARRWPDVESRLRRRFGSGLVLIEETTSSGSAREQAAAMARAGCDLVIAAGGDGTVSQVMQGLLGSECALAILPFGTGNDFARAIGVGPNPRLALEALSSDLRVRVDVGRWTQGELSGHFLNVAGCGFDSAVAARINSGIRRLRGRSAYLYAILQTLRTYRPTALRIQCDGESLTRKAMLCALANGTCYGGGLRIAPTASITDGLLDLVLVGDLGRVEFLREFPRVFRGTHLSHPKVEHRTFWRLEIESDPPVPFLVDGELVASQRAVVEVVPAAVEVVVGGAAYERLNAHARRDGPCRQSGRQAADRNGHEASFRTHRSP